MTIEYQLTDMGRERARRYTEHCAYFGAAPVSLSDYIDSVGAQSLTNQHPTAEDLRRAFTDLLLNKRILDRLGPAINSGRGLFLYGAPGNGKTSIAERVTTPSVPTSGYREPSSSTARSFACSTRLITTRPPCSSETGWSMTTRLTGAGCASVDPRSS